MVTLTPKIQNLICPSHTTKSLEIHYWKQWIAAPISRLIPLKGLKLNIAWFDQTLQMLPTLYAILHRSFPEKQNQLSSNLIWMQELSICMSTTILYWVGPHAAPTWDNLKIWFTSFCNKPGKSRPDSSNLQSSQSQWWDSAIYPFIVNITLELQIKSTSKTYGWWRQVYNFCWALSSPLNFHKKLFYSTEEKNL